MSWSTMLVRRTGLNEHARREGLWAAMSLHVLAHNDSTGVGCSLCILTFQNWLGYMNMCRACELGHIDCCTRHA